MPRLMDARTPLILQMHLRQMPVHEIARAVRKSETAVASILYKRGYKPKYTRPRKKIDEAVREQRFSRVDALVESGEPDRRVLCYQSFERGETNEEAAAFSGASMAEVRRFRKQKPKNWIIWRGADS